VEAVRGGGRKTKTEKKKKKKGRKEKKKMPFFEKFGHGNKDNFTPSTFLPFLLHILCPEGEGRCGERENKKKNTLCAVVLYFRIQQNTFIYPSVVLCCVARGHRAKGVEQEQYQRHDRSNNVSTSIYSRGCQCCLVCSQCSSNATIHREGRWLSCTDNRSAQILLFYA
jgi:hypothetical protein